MNETQTTCRSFHPAAKIRWYCLNMRDDSRLIRLEPDQRLMEWCNKRDQLRQQNHTPLCAEE